VTSQPSLSWLVRPLKHCLNGTSSSNLQLIGWQYTGKTFWIGYCFSAPFSLHSSFKVELPRNFSHVPKYSQSGTHSLEDRKAFMWWVQKHLNALKLNQLGNLPTPWMRQLPSKNYISLQVRRMPNVTQWEPGALFQASVFPTSTKHANTHWLPGASRWPHEFTSSRHTNSFPFVWGIHGHKHATAKDCLGFSRQWNCYHLSGEGQVSGTQQPME
jgi:hypothetical protein